MNRNQIIIWLLAGFLITYHTVKIYSGLVESGDAAASIIAWSYIYSVRLWIIVSLLLVIMFKRLGVISMWVSILTLVVIQYAQLAGDLGFTDYLAPLRGFIIPLLISWLFWSPQEKTQAED